MMRKPKKKLPTRKQLQARVTRLNNLATKLYDQREAAYAQAKVISAKHELTETALGEAIGELDDFDRQEEGNYLIKLPWPKNVCPHCGGGGDGYAPNY
jgi:hypothetical protein